VEQDEPPVELYDFLYRDTGRFTSYYSQIFEGRLTSLEETDTDRETSDRKLGGNLQVVSGTVSKADEIASSSKRTIDPADLIPSDVLSSLQDGAFIRTDIAAAPHGSIIHAKGAIVFADKHILEMSAVVFQTLIAAEKQKPKNKQDNEALNNYGMIEGLMRKIPLPSAFILQTSDIQIAGTLKDEGMVEPISTYYFRHGSHGLSDVYLIGIKEVPSDSVTLPQTAFLTAAQQTAEVLTTFLLPTDAIRVTPLAFYRKLTPEPEQSQ
jgi:hypothetical protein